jgi:hypothetical protein
MSNIILTAVIALSYCITLFMGSATMGLFFLLSLGFIGYRAYKKHRDILTLMKDKNYELADTPKELYPNYEYPIGEKMIRPSSKLLHFIFSSTSKNYETHSYLLPALYKVSCIATSYLVMSNMAGLMISFVVTFILLSPFLLIPPLIVLAIRANTYKNDKWGQFKSDVDIDDLYELFKDQGQAQVEVNLNFIRGKVSSISRYKNLGGK